MKGKRYGQGILMLTEEKVLPDLHPEDGAGTIWNSGLREKVGRKQFKRQFNIQQNRLIAERSLCHQFAIRQIRAKDKGDLQ